MDQHGLAFGDPVHVGFGDVGAHFQLAIPNDREQRTGAGAGNRSDTGAARRDDAGNRRLDLGPCQPKVDILHLRVDQRDIGLRHLDRFLDRADPRKCRGGLGFGLFGLHGRIGTLLGKRPGAIARLHRLGGIRLDFRQLRL